MNALHQHKYKNTYATILSLILDTPSKAIAQADVSGVVATIDNDFFETADFEDLALVLAALHYLDKHLENIGGSGPAIAGQIKELLHDKRWPKYSINRTGAIAVKVPDTDYSIPIDKADLVFKNSTHNLINLYRYVAENEKKQADQDKVAVIRSSADQLAQVVGHHKQAEEERGSILSKAKFNYHNIKSVSATLRGIFGVEPVGAQLLETCIKNQKDAIKSAPEKLVIQAEQPTVGPIEPLFVVQAEQSAVTQGPPSTPRSPSSSPTIPRSPRPVARSSYVGRALRTPEFFIDNLANEQIQKPELYHPYKAFYDALRAQLGLSFEATSPESTANTSIDSLLKLYDTLVKDDNLPIVGPYLGLGAKPDKEKLAAYRQWLKDLQVLTTPELTKTQAPRVKATPQGIEAEAIETKTAESNVSSSFLGAAAGIISSTSAEAPPTAAGAKQKLEDLAKLTTLSEMQRKIVTDALEAIDTESVKINTASAQNETLRGELQAVKEKIQTTQTKFESVQKQINARHAILDKFIAEEGHASDSVTAIELKGYNKSLIADLESEKTTLSDELVSYTKAKETLSQSIESNNTIILDAKKATQIDIPSAAFNDIFNSIGVQIDATKLQHEQGITSDDKNTHIKRKLTELETIQENLNKVNVIINPTRRAKQYTDLAGKIESNYSSLIGDINHRFEESKHNIGILLQTNKWESRHIVNMKNNIIDCITNQQFLASIHNDISKTTAKPEWVTKLDGIIQYLDASEGKEGARLSAQKDRVERTKFGCENITTDTARKTAIAIVRAGDALDKKLDPQSDFGKLYRSAQAHLANMEHRAAKQSDFGKFFSSSRGHVYRSIQKDSPKELDSANERPTHKVR